MKGIFSLGELKRLLREDKKMTAVLIAGAALLLFFAFGGIKSGGSRNTADAAFSAERQTQYETALEKRLLRILSDIDGVGELSVMVTLDTTERTEYGKSKDMLISVKMPQVRGVIVVCGGGGSAVVREKVVRAVSGVLGISAARVSVVK